MRKLILPILACLVLLGTVANAPAAVVTVGSPMALPFAATATDVNATVANFELVEPGANVTAPVSGTIVRWRIIGAEGGPYRLRVLRPAGPGHYTGAGTGPAVSLQPSAGPAIVPASLPMQAGDLLGLDVSKGTKLGVFKGPGMAFAYWLGFLPDGSTLPPNEADEEYELAFNADILPPPQLSAAAPASGTFKGGTTVTLSGTDLTEVSAVSFGALPAKSFTPSSETALTAVAPSAAKAGRVDISVTTPAGTAVLPKAFAYRACTVPNVIGKKLKKAKKRIRKAGCKVGKVKRFPPGVGRVLSQHPLPGKLRAPGSKVKLGVG